MTEFTKDNLPELFEYLAGYIRANPECERGFGLEILFDDKYTESDYSLVTLLESLTECSGKFRIKPATRIVYGPDGVGVECPAPLSVKPSEGQSYYVEDCAHNNFQYLSEWHDDNPDNKLFSRSLCYATAEDAAANCRARYGIEEKI